jgi:hypothetical protein
MIFANKILDISSVEDILKVGFKLFNNKSKLGKKYVLKLTC